MNSLTLALWLLALVVLGGILWFIFRKGSNPSPLVKVGGYVAGVMLVLIIVGLVVSLLMPKPKPSPLSTVKEPDVSQAVTTPGKIFLPLVGKNPAAPVAAQMAAASEPIVYTVQPGDTLYSIGRRYDVSPYAIAWANKIANPNYIQAGWVLNIPAPGSAPAAVPRPITHVVQKNDTLFSLSRHYGVSEQAIMVVNRMGSQTIYPGQILSIP